MAPGWKGKVAAMTDETKGEWDAQVFELGDSPLRVLSIDWRPDPATAMITITQQEYHDLRIRAAPLSAAWHHWPCVTTGLPDQRKTHPVLAAIGRKGDRA